MRSCGFTNIRINSPRTAETNDSQIVGGDAFRNASSLSTSSLAESETGLYYCLVFVKTRIPNCRFSCPHILCEMIVHDPSENNEMLSRIQ